MSFQRNANAPAEEHEPLKRNKWYLNTTEKLEISRLMMEALQGDMRDLTLFESETFDLIVHPVSNTFIPDVRPV